MTQRQHRINRLIALVAVALSLFAYFGTVAAMAAARMK